MLPYTLTAPPFTNGNLVTETEWPTSKMTVQQSVKVISECALKQHIAVAAITIRKRRMKVPRPQCAFPFRAKRWHGSSFICFRADSSPNFLPLLQWAAFLSLRRRTLCSEERRAGQSGAADSRREPRCPPLLKRILTLLELQMAQTARNVKYSRQNKQREKKKERGMWRREASRRWKRKQWQRGNAAPAPKSATSAFSRCEMRCPQLHTTQSLSHSEGISNSWCHKAEKYLDWYCLIMSSLRVSDTSFK